MMMKHSKGMMDGREKDMMGRVGPEKESPVEFAAPKDAGLEGDSGEASVMWRRKPDGKICILSINGAKIAGYDGESESEESPDQSPDDQIEGMES